MSARLTVCESRAVGTSDFLIRRVIRPYSKLWSALLFCDLGRSLRQRIAGFCSLPLLCGGSIYAWFSAHGASYLEALILPN